jgi:hypothetical protein
VVVVLVAPVGAEPVVEGPEPIVVVVALVVVLGATWIVVVVVPATDPGAGPDVVEVALPGPVVVVVAGATSDARVATPRPKTANRYAPSTASLARNRACASSSEMRARIFGAGFTTRLPESSSTCETKRPATTEDSDGS